MKDRLPHESLRRRHSPRRHCRCWRWRPAWPGRSASGSAPRIERRLSDEAHLIADLLSKATALDESSARRRSRSPRRSSISSRVTFIAEDGRVVGDSTQTASTTRHAREPRDATGSGRRTGARIRQQPALQHDGQTPTCCTSRSVRRTRSSRYVRLALPLTDVDAQLAAIRARDAGGAGRGDSARAARRRGSCRRRWRDASARLRASRNAIRPATSSRPIYDYGTDELGTVARALDDVRAGAGRPHRGALARSRAHGSHPRRHGRRRARRRSAGTAAAGESRRAGDAARRCRRPRAARTSK